jgi:uncharacterized protein
MERRRSLIHLWSTVTKPAAKSIANTFPPAIPAAVPNRPTANRKPFFIAVRSRLHRACSTTADCNATGAHAVFRAALDKAYGGWIERVVLFGSRARGDAGKDSDYDVAVFLRDMADRFAEMNRLADLTTAVRWAFGTYQGQPCRATRNQGSASFRRQSAFIALPTARLKKTGAMESSHRVTLAGVDDDG